MSLLQTAFVAKSRVPDRAKLEEAVRALGFDLSIDEFYQPFNCSGFLPCVLKGKKSGFEIYFGSPKEAFQNFPHLKEEAGTRDCAITFRWGGDMTECACVLIVSAALATSFDALVHYQDDDLVYTADQLVEQANQALGFSEESESSDADAPPQPPPRKPWWKLW
jgi:hypothetical protein